MSSGPAAFKRLEASPRAGRVPASVWIAPYRVPPKQASSAENAWLIPFAGLRGSRTQSTSRCRALAARVHDPVFTAWFSLSLSRHCLGVCNPWSRHCLGVCNPRVHPGAASIICPMSVATGSASAVIATDAESV